MASLPDIGQVPSLQTEARAQILDVLFEPCRQLHTLSVETLGQETFSSYDQLIVRVGQQLTALFDSRLESDRKWLDEILAAHPRLGEKKVDSEQSRAEQAQLNTGGSEEAEKLAALNREYEETFPGLRYVVFVNGRERRVIMEDMKRRIQRADAQAERQDSIQAMCDIAQDRAMKLQRT